jgi:DNA-binding response OmpR family regulator
MCVADSAAARTIREAAESDDILLLEAGSAEDALRGLEALRPSLMVLERRGDDTDSVERYLEVALHGFANVPLLVVADREELVLQSDAVPSPP